MHTFRKLEVWKKAMVFSQNIYLATQAYPKNELYGLVDQTRRAVVSIALNIAEGSGAGSNKEFIRFLQIALRSDYEVITAVELGKQLGYLVDSSYHSLLKEADELAAMITGLIKHLTLV
jgi:four helix bundle protein